MIQRLLLLLKGTASLLRPLSFLATIWALTFYFLRMDSYIVQGPFAYLVPLALVFAGLSLSIHLWDIARSSSNPFRNCLLSLFYFCNLFVIGTLAIALLRNELTCEDIVFQFPYITLCRLWSSDELFDYARKFLKIDWNKRFIYENIKIAEGSMNKFRARFQYQFQEMKDFEELVPIVIALIISTVACTEYPMAIFGSFVEWLLKSRNEGKPVQVPTDTLLHLFNYFISRPVFIAVAHSFLFATIATLVLYLLLPKIISKAKERKPS